MLRRFLKPGQHTSSPSSTNILDKYVKTTPSRQTVLDLFKGEWSSALPKSTHLITAPGKAELFEDARIIWANERLSFAGKTILELGPLEAGHSYMAQAFGASRVFAIEANTRAFMKFLIIKEIFNLDRVHFGLGDFNAYIEESEEKFDICLASGVLYHCVNLPKTLQLLSNRADNLFIWTHYYDHKIVSGTAHLKKYFRATEKSEAFGRSFEIAHKDYKEALEWKGFCGGLQEYAYWWPKDAFFHILQSLGFKSIEVGFDHPDHPNGPAFAICASDSDLPARIDSKSLRNEIPAMSKTRTSQWYFSFGQHFRLMLSIVGREIVGRYRGSAFGILWSLLTPLFMLSIYTFVFGVVMKAKWSVPGGQVREHSTAEFAVILFSGLLVFQFFSEVVGAAPGRILSNVNYVKKVVFPIEILPVVSVGVALFHVGVSLLVLLLFSAFVFGLPATLPLAPLVFAPFVLLTLGLAWFFAAVGVYLRDIGQIIGPVLTASMFLSPIFFPRTALPDWLQPWLIFHPLTIPVETFRNVVVFGVQPDWIALAVYACVAALVAMLGYLFFQKTRRGFADVL